MKTKELKAFLLKRRNDDESNEKGLEAAWYDYRVDNPNSVDALMEYSF